MVLHWVETKVIHLLTLNKTGAHTEADVWQQLKRLHVVKGNLLYCFNYIAGPQSNQNLLQGPRFASRGERLMAKLPYNEDSYSKR